MKRKILILLAVAVAMAFVAFVPKSFDKEVSEQTDPLVLSVTMSEI